MPGSREVLKPAASTLNVYVAGCREGSVYRPSVSHVADRENPVPSSLAVTFAEATEAPEGSVTRPTILPKPWASEGDA
jgi:hypothetical protein